MKKTRLITMLSAFALAAAGFFAFGASKAEKKQAEKVDATDYSSTIRVYVDLTWDNINFVRVGTTEDAGNTVLTTSNAKYNQDLGKYVRDIVDDHDYDAMGCFFKQDNYWWWRFKDNDGYYDRGNGLKFKRGFEYQIKDISYEWEDTGNQTKGFKCNVYEIGEIRDNAQNSTFYFVDGYSWHSNVRTHFWGGTASCAAFPGNSMIDSNLRLKAYVGETEYGGLHIYQYTLSGSAAYVQFANNADQSQKTLDLALIDGGIYWYGVDEGVYEGVVELLVLLKSQLGSHTFNGRNFGSSICHLDQTQASTFVSTYNTLEGSSNVKIQSSVRGSGLITYNDPENSNTATGEVSLSEVKVALVNKYPALVSLGSKFVLFGDTSKSANVAIIIVISLVSVTAIGGFFFIKKRKSI